MSQKLIIVRGLPGSGKSTFAAGIQLSKTVVIEADMFHLMDGKYVYRPEMAGFAHEWCQAQVAWNLNQGNDVIVANTFITMRTVVPYYELAQTFGASLSIKTMTGKYGSVHDVPDKVIEHMTETFETFDVADFLQYYEEFHAINGVLK